MEPSLTFTGAVVRCPCVYVWRRDGVALYVGMSRHGLGRPLGRHEYLRNLLPTDQLEVFFYPGMTSAELNRLESDLIDRLEPSLNARHRQYMLTPGRPRRPRPATQRVAYR
jgi:hypothetical protein